MEHEITFTRLRSGEDDETLDDEFFNFLAESGADVSYAYDPNSGVCTFYVQFGA